MRKRLPGAIRRKRSHDSGGIWVPPRSFNASQPELPWQFSQPAPLLDAAPGGERMRHMRRTFFFSLGCLMVALGLIGALLPLMPTTIFLILAAGCFARSSPACELWLLEHPRFGPTLRGWREEGAISRQAKGMACVGMTVGFLLFCIGAHPSVWLLVSVAAVMLASGVYVVSRPQPNLNQRTAGTNAEHD